jgi:hypothetical protein
VVSVVVGPSLKLGGKVGDLFLFALRLFEVRSWGIWGKVEVEARMNQI